MRCEGRGQTSAASCNIKKCCNNKIINHFQTWSNILQHFATWFYIRFYIRFITHHSVHNSSIISFVALCIMLVYIGTCYWSQRNRSFIPFPNDFFRWSETSCLEMLLFSSSSRFDEEGLEEWTFSRGRVLERVSYFKTTKKILFWLSLLLCYSITNVKNKWFG